MRRQAGIAGATLIYGQHDRCPDMILALQFLLDDLRRDGRKVSGVRLAGHTLRLRVEDFELAASIASEPLPVTAFSGVLRPVLNTADGSGWNHDLAKGRLLHSVRHHRWALGVLLRARWGADDGGAKAGLELGAECRRVVAAMVEACPAQFILWQASGVLFTLAEFQNLPAPRLNEPGDPRSAIHPRPPPAAPVHRPTSPDWMQPRDEGVIGDGAPLVRPPATARGGVATPSIVQDRDQRSRLDRKPPRSTGRLFRRCEDRRHPPQQIAPDRSQRRLSRAFGRSALREEISGPQRVSRRRSRMLRSILLALPLAVLLPPWVGV